MAKPPVLLSVAIALCSCSPSAENEDGSTSGLELATTEPTEASEPATLSPVQPSHNYNLKEGDVYSYIAALTEDDRKAGKAAGAVIAFKYYGVSEQRFQLMELDDGGQNWELFSCANPCVVIASQRRKIAYNEDSIIGAAFADAIAGRLEVAAEARPKPAARPKIGNGFAIPSNFRGLWAASQSDCGSQQTDTNLEISANMLSFYESEALAYDVDITSATSLRVSATSSGEGDVWDSAFKLDLSPDGTELAITSGNSTFTRYRCS